MVKQYEEGLRVRNKVMGIDFVNAAFAKADDFTHPLQEFITRNAWGTVWCRSGLDLKSRSLVTLGILTDWGALTRSKAMYVALLITARPS